MKALIYLFLCVSLSYGWPQRTIETYNEPLGDLSEFDYPEEGIYEPFIDDGLLETYGSPDAMEGGGGPGGEGDILIEDHLPDAAVPDTIVFNQSPLKPTLTYGYKRRNPFENPFDHRGSTFQTIFRTRPSRRPSILDHVFSRDWMRPVQRPVVDRFPSFHFRIGSQPRPSFRIPEIFSFPTFNSQFPREEIPQTFDSNIPWEEESANPGTDEDPNFFENDQDSAQDGTHNSHHGHHHPGHFLHHFMRPMSFGGFDSAFGNFPDLPPNYSNSTSTVKEVNGTKIRVNETIHKKSGNNFNTFFHFKVIHADHPEMEQEEETTLSPEEDVFQLEDVPENEAIIPDDETVIQDEITEEPIKYVPSEESTRVTSVVDPEFIEAIVPSFDVDFRENEIFNDEGMDEGNSNNVYHEISPKVGNNF